MHENNDKTYRERTIVLPLPLWLLVGVWQCAVWLSTKLMAMRARRNKRVLPNATTYQKDQDCAQLAWLLYLDLNEYRLSRGLPQLTWNEQLEQSSLYHGQRMKETGQFEHMLDDGVDLGERLQSHGYGYLVCAENLAYFEYPNVSIEALAEKIHEGWVQSPGHHLNLITTDCVEVGIGVVKSGRGYYAVQNFGKPAVPYQTQLFSPKSTAGRVTSSSRT